MVWSWREGGTPDGDGMDDEGLARKENCKIGTLANTLY